MPHIHRTISYMFAFFPLRSISSERCSNENRESRRLLEICRPRVTLIRTERMEKLLSRCSVFSIPVLDFVEIRVSSSDLTADDCANVLLWCHIPYANNSGTFLHVHISKSSQLFPSFSLFYSVVLIFLSLHSTVLPPDRYNNEPLLLRHTTNLLAWKFFKSLSIPFTNRWITIPRVKDFSFGDQPFPEALSHSKPTRHETNIVENRNEITNQKSFPTNHF